MAMNLEFELRKGLKNPNLTPAERIHLESLRQVNSAFLDENRDLIEVNPNDFAPGQVKSLLDLDFDTIYRIYRRNFANLKFTPSDLIRVTDVGYEPVSYSEKKSFSIRYQILLGKSSMSFGGANAFDLGLETSPYVEEGSSTPKWNDRAYLVPATEQEVLSVTRSSQS